MRDQVITALKAQHRLVGECIAAVEQGQCPLASFISVTDQAPRPKTPKRKAAQKAAKASKKPARKTWGGKNRA